MSFCHKISFYHKMSNCRQNVFLSPCLFINKMSLCHQNVFCHQHVILLEWTCISVTKICLPHCNVFLSSTCLSFTQMSLCHPNIFLSPKCLSVAKYLTVAKMYIFVTKYLFVTNVLLSPKCLAVTIKSICKTKCLSVNIIWDSRDRWRDDVWE